MKIEKEFVFIPGVYFHPKKGIAVLSGELNGWEVDKNLKKPHPLLRINIQCVERGTGEYFLQRSLKNYEFVGEF